MTKAQIANLLARLSPEARDRLRGVGLAFNFLPGPEHAAAVPDELAYFFDSLAMALDSQEALQEALDGGFGKAIRQAHEKAKAKIERDARAREVA